MAGTLFVPLTVESVRVRKNQRRRHTTSFVATAETFTPRLRKCEPVTPTE